jgi:uncharacterized integral membrane protein (TIGR00697 family)
VEPNLFIFILSCILIGSANFLFARLGAAGLTTWVSLCGLLANLFVLKQIELAGFNATASDSFAVGALFGLNILQEKFGYEAAKQAIWISFASLSLFAITSYLHLAYLPSSVDTMHETYKILLQPVPRLLFASLLTFFIVQRFDAFMYSIIRSQNLAPMLVISPFCIMISQAIDTILFTVLGLVGILEKPLHIMLVSYSVKLIVIFGIFISTQIIFLKTKQHDTTSKSK